MQAHLDLKMAFEFVRAAASEADYSEAAAAIVMAAAELVEKHLLSADLLLEADEAGAAADAVVVYFGLADFAEASIAADFVFVE